MTFRDGRQLVFPALVVAAVAAGCSSTPATAKAFVKANLQASSSAVGSCNFSAQTQILSIGTADPTKPLSDSNPQRVNNGTTQAGSVILDCLVRQTGSTFTIAVSAEVNNNLAGGGGSMTITGSNVDPTTGGTVTGAFAQGPVLYQDTNCTLTYTFEGSPISLQNNAPKIAPGRIWAHVDCPMASAMSSQSGQSFVCDGNADFVFENCRS
jgi:hypothetical protein